jgi:hypothetical protein
MNIALLSLLILFLGCTGEGKIIKNASVLQTYVYPLGKKALINTIKNNLRASLCFSEAQILSIRYKDNKRTLMANIAVKNPSAFRVRATTPGIGIVVFDIKFNKKITGFFSQIPKINRPNFIKNIEEDIKAAYLHPELLSNTAAGITIKNGKYIIKYISGNRQSIYKYSTKYLTLDEKIITLNNKILQHIYYGDYVNSNYALVPLRRLTVNKIRGYEIRVKTVGYKINPVLNMGIFN